MIYRLVAMETVEERILDLQQRKRELATLALEGTGQAGGLSRDDLVEHRGAMEHYCRLDVLCLKDLFWKRQDIMQTTFGYHIVEFLTLPQMMYKVWTQTVGDGTVIQVVPELLVNCMEDVKPGFLEWEWH